VTTPHYYNWDNLPETPMASQIGRRLVSGEKMTVVMLNLARGAMVGQHQHPHEQMIYVISGKIDFESSDGKRVLTGIIRP
jgi:quercetin dioxygenase-like cupin family protein